MSRPRRAVNHGDYAFAQRERCPCTPCRRSVARYTKAQRYDQVRGVARRLDAAPVREHVQSLFDGGAQLVQVANAAGVHRTPVRHLMGRAGNRVPSQWVQRSTAEALLGVTLAQALGEQALVDSIGVRRRIEALQWMGHAKSAVAEAIGVSESQAFQYVIYPRAYLSTIRRVDDAYRRLRDTHGASEFTRWRSYRRDYKPPMAWDDDTIDNPAIDAGSVSCVVKTCTREVREMSLCGHHLRGFFDFRGDRSDGRTYRLFVVRAGETTKQRQKGTLGPLVHELRDLGVSISDAARRLDVDYRHVERLWHS